MLKVMPIPEGVVRSFFGKQIEHGAYRNTGRTTRPRSPSSATAPRARRTLIGLCLRL